MLDWTLERLRSNDPYSLVLAGCGTGKTLFAYKLADEIDTRKTLVLTTKAGVPSAWIREHELWCKDTILIAPTKGTVKQKAALLDENYGSPIIYVVNYETAWRMGEVIRNYGFDLVIADESHKLQSNASKVSRKLARYCADIPYKVCMTGTAWDDRPSQVYGQARFLDPSFRRSQVVSEIFGNWSEFRDKFEYTRDIGGNRIITVGYKNQPILADMMSKFTIHINSEDVLDLPEYQDIYRYVPLQGEIRRVYIEMEEWMLANLNEGLLIADNRLVQALRLHQLCRGHHPDGWVCDPKDNAAVQETLAVLDEIGNEPVVIFTRFTADVQIIKSVVEKMGKTVKLLVGGKHEHIEWQDGEGDVLIANISAGSESVDLTRARYVIYYSKGHGRTQYNQSRYRIRRPNSTRPITFFHIVVKRTVDEDIEHAMVNKGRVADYLLKSLVERVKTCCVLNVIAEG